MDELKYLWKSLHPKSHHERESPMAYIYIYHGVNYEGCIVKRVENMFSQFCINIILFLLGPRALQRFALINRLPRWRKDPDVWAWWDANIWQPAVNIPTTDREVNVDSSTSLYGVWYHAVFLVVSSLDMFIASWDGASLGSSQQCFDHGVLIDLYHPLKHIRITSQFEFLTHQAFTFWCVILHGCVNHENPFV